MTVPASALPPPVAILLYWDNTLCDSWAVIHPAMTATIEALGGRPWTLEETRRNVRQSARDAFPALFGARADQATAVFYRTYEADHLDRLPPLPGAEAMLQALAGAGDLTLGVVSNKRGPPLRLEAARPGRARHFGCPVCATHAATGRASWWDR